MITLTHNGTTLTLNDDLYWSDEHDWQPVEQTVSRSVTGALIVEAAARIGGRPITLIPIDENSAWTTLADLTLLRAWAAVAGRVMSLNIRGVARDVMFSHQDTGAISAKPIIHYSLPDTTDNYLVSFKFMEI